MKYMLLGALMVSPICNTHASDKDLIKVSKGLTKIIEAKRTNKTTIFYILKKESL